MEQRTPPHWSPDRHGSRLRLLVENPCGALRDADFRLFEQAGFDVAVCSGPDAESPCSLVEQSECSLADTADVVLFGLGLADERHRRVLQALRREVPTTPVVVEMPRTGADAHAPPDGCIALAFPMSVEGQVRVLRHAAATSRARRAPRRAGGGDGPA